jgi:hypothetical protein
LKQFLRRLRGERRSREQQTSHDSSHVKSFRVRG